MGQPVQLFLPVVIHTCLPQSVFVNGTSLQNPYGTRFAAFPPLKNTPRAKSNEYPILPPLRQDHKRFLQAKGWGVNKQKAINQEFGRIFGAFAPKTGLSGGSAPRPARGRFAPLQSLARPGSSSGGRELPKAIPAHNQPCNPEGCSQPLGRARPRLGQKKTGKLPRGNFPVLVLVSAAVKTAAEARVTGDAYI
jgi:hypothetical protein